MDALLSLDFALMTLTTRLYTFFNGQLVGVDQFGNRYYRTKSKAPGMRRGEKRWVIYNGLPEPSKVPPEWHGWLHYTLEKPPTQRKILRYSWMKPPLPNLTGTKNAYM